MTNRIQHLFEDRAESPRTGEYFVVAGEFGQVFVTRAMARQLGAALSRFIPPRWIDITTLFGTTLRVRACMIQTIVESTAVQRTAARKFWRALDAEESAERNPYEND